MELALHLVKCRPGIELEALRALSELGDKSVDAYSGQVHLSAYPDHVGQYGVEDDDDGSNSTLVQRGVGRSEEAVNTVRHPPHVEPGQKRPGEQCEHVFPPVSECVPR